MKIETAVTRLTALAQVHRLAVFRLLVRKGADGMPAGEIAAALKLAPNALSFHLKGLSAAGLITSRQDGRYVIYSPDFKAMNGLLDYLTENCCADGALDAACAPPQNCQDC
ncbi:ArsR/SmtB family transcription factor [Solimonas marina]|uniref:Helix-turn-helix transcriptional regulator n=1 Tax=Solimonas marina TaxID=2714601 RepID=A0A969W9A5_9GAMM|nr:metalloregulator ArsR/SmtB family transcription factor [Solimonas marina]NKF23012.1 helix-turn-helix transcriptional regulator [Solimonas marina]